MLIIQKHEQANEGPSYIRERERERERERKGMGGVEGRRELHQRMDVAW